jgi:hypothetical protein
MLALVALSCLLVQVLSHGHLSTPAARDSDRAVYQMNAPVARPLDSEFVCRNHEATTPQTVLYAGQPFTIEWDFSASHVGDCYVYLSYDTDLPDLEQKWFKIAQIAKCNEHNQQPMLISVPDYLPSCEHCVMRWEWIALHARPTIEFYAQCVDVTILGLDNGVLPSPMVTIPGHLPETCCANNEYRDAFTPGAPFFFTGPQIATLDGGPIGIPSPEESSSSSSTAESDGSSSSGSSGSSSTADAAGSMPPSSTSIIHVVKPPVNMPIVNSTSKLNFADYDLNGDGVLSPTEFQNVVNDAEQQCDDYCTQKVATAAVAPIESCFQANLFAISVCLIVFIAALFALHYVHKRRIDEMHLALKRQLEGPASAMSPPSQTRSVPPTTRTCTPPLHPGSRTPPHRQV